MKRYILYGFVSLLFFITVDKIIGYISYKKLTASNVYFYGEINNAIADTSKVFILGSSRAECHYDSQELKSLFGKSVYNAGTGGYGIFYSYAILKERIARNIPEIVILDVEPTILNDAKQFGILTKLNAMTDFYPSFNEIVALNPDHKPYFMFLNSYKYNSTAFNLFRISDKTDGFIPLAETMNVNAKISYHDPNEFSKEELKIIDAIYKKQLIYLDKIYELCKQNNCRLLFVTSPAFVDYDKDGIIKAPLRRHFAEKGYKLINFTNDSRFLKHRLFFKDQQHLNAKGAKIYTRAFADTLLSITSNEVLHDHLK